jgi:hypothetical protein
VAKVANISTGVKVAIFEFKHGHHAKVPTKMALVSGKNHSPPDENFCQVRNFPRMEAD